MRIICFFYFMISAFIFAHERPFVYGELLGRMGNYLFEVAATSATAWDHGAIPYFPHLEELSPRNPLRSHVLFRCNKVKPPKNLHIAHEWATPATGYQPIQYKPNMKLGGYCQSYKYFSHHRKRILQLFAPQKRDMKLIQRKYNSILTHPKTTSVHVRHYYAEVPGNAFLQFDKEYYEKAISLFPEDTLFVVTSDNIAYAKEIIPYQNKRNIRFIENEPFYIDFHIQRLCKNNIIANSSFSWWSAWMNENRDKVVVRPDRWLAGYADIDCPSDWIRIKASCYQDRMAK